MSKLLKNNNNNKPSSLYESAIVPTTITASAIPAAAAASFPTHTEDNLLRKQPTIKENRNSTSTLLLSHVDVVPSSSSLATSLFSMTEQESVQLTHVTTSTSSGSGSESGRRVFRTMPSFKIMGYQNIIALLTVLVCSLVTVSGLKCYMCGQYNEGVGSITPCLNYSEQYAHLYLKECSKKSEKYCVKYVSELSIVRDCATECAEKEIWETQTYCCTEDGCNGSTGAEASAIVVMLPVIIYVANAIMNVFKPQRR